MTKPMPNITVVTGAARGMGEACARRLHRPGEPMVLVDLDADGAYRVANDLGDDVAVVTCDLSDPAGVAVVVDQVREMGTLRALAHAAGISPTMGSWQRIMAVDLRASALLLEGLRPCTREGSAAVCFASVAAELGPEQGDSAIDPILDDPLGPEFIARLAALDDPRILDPTSCYGWAKRGVVRLVAREAITWGARGARVNAVSPGMIDTPMGAQELEQQPLMAVMLEHTPLGRFGRADEIAALVEFLVSGDASFVTGANVIADGGVVAGLRLTGGLEPL
jgi:NAD(P)-dependent dehydrogenase (short-subunit alcohol dehydrogenase family)